MATKKKKGDLIHPLESKGTGSRAKTEITMRKSEEWSAEPETIARVQSIAQMIVNGVARATIQSQISKEYGIGDRQTRAYYNAALRYLQPEDEDEYRKGLIQANVDRLERIVEEGMKDNRNLKVAKDAIAEINKMLGLGGNKVQIARDENNNEVINISFD